MSKIFGKLELPDNKDFGKAFSLVLLGLSALSLFFGNFSLALFTFLFGLLVLSLSFVFPSVLTPLNIIWMGLGYVIGLVARPLTFGVIFYLVLSPLALLLRMLRRDELRISTKWDSQWVKREEASQIPEFPLQY